MGFGSRSSKASILLFSFSAVGCSIGELPEFGIIASFHVQTCVI